VVIDAAGKQIATIRVAHAVEGLDKLVAFLRSVGDVAEQPDHLAGVIETNTGLLITTLLEAGRPVYPVNPRTLEKLRAPSGAKTDAIDAYLLARKGRSDLPDLRRLEPDSPIVHELKLLTRDQEGLIQMQTRLVNQLTACLKASSPVALELFARLHQGVTVAFLQAVPTSEQARAATLEQLAALLQAHRHPHGAAKAQEIWQHLRAPQMQADVVTTRAKARLMLALVAQLAPLVEQITAYDTEITRLFRTHADHGAFASLPGAGQRLAPRLLAEWGDDRGRYDDRGR
jgi:transposase